MKNRFIIYAPISMILIFTDGCKHPTIKQNEIAKTDSLKESVLKYRWLDSVLAGEKDTIVVQIDSNIVDSFYKKFVEKEIRYFPDFIRDYPDDPDRSYTISMNTHYPNLDDSEQLVSFFGCEQCQDEYYTLYAYFLKYKNEGDKYKLRRSKLINIYRDINRINSCLNHGGTLFAHQYRRILAYAEYSIYRFARDSTDFDKPYNLSAQKKLFLNSLRQHIHDEISIDKEILGSKSKSEEEKEDDNTVDNLDGLITDYFYLSMAQTFQYSNY